MKLNGSPAEQEPRPILFGDNQEFQYVGCVEEIDPDGAVEDVTIFYQTHTGKRYGVTISLIEDQVEQTDSSSPSEEESVALGIESDYIDPSAVLGVMQLSSEQLLQYSVQITDL